MRHKLLLTLAALLLAAPTQAHRLWLLPSDTVLAGESAWITVDAAVSNDLFFFNHVPLRLDHLDVRAPDGSRLAAQNPHTGKYRSVFDLELKQQGSYRIAIAQQGLTASWKEDGQSRRWRGTAERFATEVPKDAEDLVVVQSASRIETFATLGSPTPIGAVGSGLELLPLTHPNDLFAGESARFRLMIDGQPAPDVEVALVPGGTRYRNASGETVLRTDAEGILSVTWPAPGMYWLEASFEDDKATLAPATRRRAGYALTLEVLPE